MTATVDPKFEELLAVYESKVRNWIAIDGDHIMHTDEGVARAAR